MRLIMLFLLTMGYPLTAMDYYSFIIDDKKVGYFETELKDGITYQNAYLEMEGQQFENPFWFKQKDGAVIAFKFADEDWKVLSDYPDNAYPTCAFILLVLKVTADEPFHYQQINEGKNVVTGKATITRAGNKIQETVDEKLGRYVVVNDKNEIIEIGWGGTARSLKVADKAQAIKDTAFGQ